MNKITALLCALFLLFTGCYMAERFSTKRIISLSFPVPAGQERLRLSVGMVEVEKALNIIEAMILSEGFVRETGQQSQQQPDFARSYVRLDDRGEPQFGTIYLGSKNNCLEIIFLESPNRSGHLTATKKIFNSLRKELISHYGPKRVKVDS